MTDVPIEDVLRQHPASHGLDEVFTLAFLSRHQQVISGFHLPGGVLSAKPVGHHHPVEAPFVPQNIGQQVGTLRSIRTVDFIVRTHDGPRFRLLHRNFERLEIDFPEGTRRHHHIVAGPVRFLVVQGKMLQRSADPVRLDAFNHGRRHLACQQRVFGIIFKVSSVQRVPVDIGSRPQQHIHAIAFCFISHGFSYLLHQFRVPSRSQQGFHRKMGTVESLARILTCRRDTHARRPVCQHRRRNTQAGNCIGFARSARH